MAIESTHDDNQRFFPPAVEEKLVGLLGRASGFALLLTVGFLWIALATWTIKDPSLTLATSGPVHNWAGAPGAVLADVLLQMFGLAAVFALFAPMIWSFELIKARQVVGFRHKIPFYPISVVLFAGALSSLPASPDWPINYGHGGILGDFVFGLVSGALSWINPTRAGDATGVLLAALGLSALMRSLGLELRDIYRILFQPIRNWNWRAKTDSWQNVLLAEAKRVRNSLGERGDGKNDEGQAAVADDNVSNDSRPDVVHETRDRLREELVFVMPRQATPPAAPKPVTQAQPHFVVSQPGLPPGYRFPLPQMPDNHQVQQVPMMHTARGYVNAPPRAPMPTAPQHPSAVAPQLGMPVQGGSVPQRPVSAHHGMHQQAMAYQNNRLAHAHRPLPAGAAAALPTQAATLPAGLNRIAPQQQRQRPELPPTTPHPISNPFDAQPRNTTAPPAQPQSVQPTVRTAPRTEPLSQPQPQREPARELVAKSEAATSAQAIGATAPSSIAERFAHHAAQMSADDDAENTSDLLGDDDAEQSRAMARRFAPQASNTDPERDALQDKPVVPQPSGVIVPTVMNAAKTKPSRQRFVPPSTKLLTRPDVRVAGVGLDRAILQGKAEHLQQVLADFGVKGAIRNIHPGPVVTLYEFEPARGIKSSRVIGLADDIARSMSAVSARVAVVPGRNAIGIELPNEERAPVLLRELLDSTAYRGSSATLPLTLGKSISGEAVVADLARMPHLLVAGTTGSGKSVGVNAMVLSILYKHAPDTCRFLMIDPKMLELSVYNDIPHLLSPVITDPQKAVVALNWAVREMEERYKRMSKLSVRNISVYNNRIRNARKKGESLSRTVHTGFDAQGQATYENQEMALEELPNIVIVVDEFADLMLVAGKEIEAAIQRLAQMARAAGIHLIMATQRPSVDVITGTIKANFPTRISFKVTSKVDSRTILNEQGAEQLLGQGDMLFASGGGQTIRVHGPFVSDDEVEAIANYLKGQAAPSYVAAVTEEAAPEATSATSAAKSDGDDLYDRAVALVIKDGKASTSYVQRRLSIGYNRAADLIERMEQAGVISAAGRGGKREILVSDVAAATSSGATDHAA